MEYTPRLRQAVIDMLENVGIDVTYQKFSNNNIMIRCPFAHISGHQSGFDGNPSFGIKITNNGFLFNCFTCDRRGRSLVALVKQLNEENVSSAKTDDAYKIQNSINIKFPDYYAKYEDNPRKVKLTNLRNYSNDDLQFLEYNKDRGIGKDIINIFRLRFDKKNQQVIMPVFNSKDKLIGTVKHYINGQLPKYSNDFDTGHYLYGEWFLRKRTGIIVEGMYDAIKVYKYLKELNWFNKYSVVGTFGANITNSQVNRMIKYFNTLILMGDHDDAGYKMNKSTKLE